MHMSEIMPMKAVHFLKEKKKFLRIVWVKAATFFLPLRTDGAKLWVDSS
jgi:hypothetical protein